MNIMIRFHVYGLIAAALAMTSQCFAWSGSGHKAVVEVAMELSPSLREKLKVTLADLPESKEWQTLKSSGLKEPNPFETEKDDPDSWVQALAAEPEKAGTFADSEERRSTNLTSKAT